MTRLVLLLVGLLGLSLVSCQTEYKPGKTYHYQYLAYMLSGSPDFSNEYAGFKYDLSFHLHCISKVASGMKMILHIKNVTQHQVSGDISPAYPDIHDPPEKIIESKNCKRFDSVSQEDLKRPVEFIWSKQGHVSDLTKHPDDSIDAGNIKRGILSMLCGSFGLIPVNHKDGVGSIDWALSDGIQGKCPTGYTYSRIGDKSNGFFELVKYQDLTRCTNLPTKLHSDFPPETCKRCKNPVESEENRNERVQTEAQTRFNVTRKNADMYFLNSAVVHSRSAMVTMGRDRRHDFVTFINQKLVFTKEYAEKKPTPKVEGNKPTELKMEIPPNQRVKNFNAEAETILGEMKKSTLTTKFAKLQTRLSKLLQQASVKEINDVLKLAKARKLQINVEQILPAVGTNASIQVIIKRVENKNTKFDDMSLARLVVISSVASSGDPRYLINEFTKLANSNDIKTKARAGTLRSLWIGLGSLYGKLRTKENDAKLSQEVNKLAMKWNEEDKDEKIMDRESKVISLLMALGNAGLVGTKDLIYNYMKRKYTIGVRIEALRALRKIAPEIPKELRQLVYPIFVDPSEDNEVRINAFMIMAKSNPSRYHMAIITEHLIREKNQNIRNFVVSYFMALATKRDIGICKMGMVLNARWVIRTLPRRMAIVSQFQSRVFYLPIKGTNFLVLYGSIIYAKDSALPRCIYLAEGYMTSERNGQFMGTEFRHTGSQRSLRNLLNRFGNIASVLNILDLGAKSSGSNMERKKSQMFIRSSAFGENTYMLKGPVREVLKKFGNLLKGSASYLIEDSYQQATSIGLPLTVERAISGSRLVKIKPKINKIKKGMEVKADITFSSAVVMQGSLGTIIGRATAKIGMDLQSSIFPGGKTTMMFKHSTTKTGCIHQFHLKPPGKKHMIIEKNARLYRILNDGKAKKDIETDLGLQVNMTEISVKGTPSMPYEMKYKIYPKKYQYDTKQMAVPSYTSLVINEGKVCGFEIEYKMTNLKKKEGDSENGDGENGDGENGDGENGDDGSAADVIALKELTPTKQEDDDVLMPYSMHTSFPGLANKKFDLKFCVFFDGTKMMKKTIGQLTLDIKTAPNSRSVSVSMTAKMKKMKMSVDASITNTGANVYFNPSNPFEITKNTGCQMNMSVSFGRRKLFSLQRKESISNEWVDTWRQMLNRPEQLSRDYPMVYQCIKDIEKDREYSSSPNCIQTWEMLQTYNERTTKISGMPESVGNYMKGLLDLLKQMFTTMNVGIRNSVFTGSMSFNPNDRKAMKLQMMLKRVGRGYPFFMTCGIGINRKRKTVIVNTFDGYNYNAMVPQSLFTKSKSLLVAQDRRRKEFTIAFSYQKDKHHTFIDYKLDGKKCTIKVMFNKKGEIETDSEGDACSKAGGGDTYKVSTGCNFFYNAVHVSIPRLNIKIETSPCRNLRVQLGMRYHDGLRGLCGDMDREPYDRELRGKSCKNTKFFRNANAFVKDNVVKNPLDLKKCGD